VINENTWTEEDQVRLDQLNSMPWSEVVRQNLDVEAVSLRVKLREAGRQQKQLRSRHKNCCSECIMLQKQVQARKRQDEQEARRQEFQQSFDWQKAVAGEYTY
jgi:hypothetical protein